MNSRHFVSDANGKLIFDRETTQWFCDPNTWSYFGILGSVKDIGHVEVKELWYSLGGESMLEDRLELLTDDYGAMHMLNIVMLNEVVHLYVVHNTLEPQIIKMIE